MDRPGPGVLRVAGIRSRGPDPAGALGRGGSDGPRRPGNDGWQTHSSGPEEAEALAAILGQIASSLPAVGEDSTLVGRLGLARGLEAFARQTRPTGSAAEAVTEAAAPLATLTSEDQGITAAKVRTLATATLIHTGRITPAQLAAAARDTEPEVRRLAMVGVGQTGTDYRTLVPSALADPEPRVRLAALAAFDRWVRPAQGCDAIVDLLDDRSPHVRMAAVDALARPCTDVAAQRGLLDSLVVDAPGEADEAVDDGQAWHVPARALSALAGLAPEAARERLTGFRTHGSPFARAWAARAATQAADLETLELLAGDSAAIVRTAAVTGLGRLGGARFRDVYLAQLDRQDPQLVMTAVGLLQSDDAEAVSRALDALDRFSDLGRETTRDVRMALLDFVGPSPHGSPDRLRPYLEDFDPVLAERAARHLSERTGTTAAASPQRLELSGTPPADELAAMERAQVVLDMARGGQIVIALRPDLAATNARRFARLALEGYFDGLTFHRVVPNFVIQGGSPGANEYAGDGPFSRDEISAMGHWRGTVGLSTRGRDTGDAQIFINLVDNNRLDFNYTIYGEVVEGMDVVDGVVEGDVITRARVVGRLR